MISVPLGSRVEEKWPLWWWMQDRWKRRPPGMGSHSSDPCAVGEASALEALESGRRRSIRA